MIRFSHRGREHSLTGGQAFSDPSKSGFRDTSTHDLLSLIKEIEAGQPWAKAVQTRYAETNPWLLQIITHTNRTSFFDTVLPSGDGLALDIGAGWGQTCRPLAKKRPVIALEPVAERLAFIQAAAKQDGITDNLAYLGTDYFDVSFATKFSVICAIGVLEWVGAFQDHTDPQKRQRDFLGKIRTELAPGGSLVLGIENRLGLKYLLGCPDDHIGVPGIACLPAPLARQRWAEQGHTLQSFTYSRPELTTLLHQAGFTRIECFAAFPDYKLPKEIISITDDGRALTTLLTTGRLPPEHNGYDGTMLDAPFQQSLRQEYQQLASAGLAQEFAPSFFVRAS